MRRVNLKDSINLVNTVDGSRTVFRASECSCAAKYHSVINSTVYYCVHIQIAETLFGRKDSSIGRVVSGRSRSNVRRSQRTVSR